MLSADNSRRKLLSDDNSRRKTFLSGSPGVHLGRGEREVRLRDPEPRPEEVRHGSGVHAMELFQRRLDLSRARARRDQQGGGRFMTAVKNRFLVKTRLGDCLVVRGVELREAIGEVPGDAEELKGQRVRHGVGERVGERAVGGVVVFVVHHADALRALYKTSTARNGSQTPRVVFGFPRSGRRGLCAPQRVCSGAGRGRGAAVK